VNLELEQFLKNIVCVCLEQLLSYHRREFWKNAYPLVWYFAIYLQVGSKNEKNAKSQKILKNGSKSKNKSQRTH